MMGFDLSEPSDWNEVLAYIGGGASLFSNSLLLIFYLSIPEVRTFFVKLLFYLSICDWFAAISLFFIGSESNSTLCNIQAGFQQFFSLASIFWMSAISFTMFMTVAKQIKIMWKYELLYHLLIWPFPIISTITIYGVHDNIARISWNDAWCWIDHNSDSHLWISLILYYIPLLLTLCIISYFYTRTIVHLAYTYNDMQLEDQHYDRYKQLQHWVSIYLMATILCRTWGVVVLFQVSFSHKNPYILLLYSFFVPLQGFVNTFLFFNSSIRKRIRQSNLCIKWSLFPVSDKPEFQPLIDSKVASTCDDNHNGKLTQSSGHGKLADLISPIFRHTNETSWLYPDEDGNPDEFNLGPNCNIKQQRNGSNNNNDRRHLNTVTENDIIDREKQLSMKRSIDVETPDHDLALTATEIHNSHKRNNSKKKIIELEESKFENEIIEEYNVFISTFNMAGYNGATPTLLDWMRCELSNICENDIDIYVFGAQEMGLDSRVFGSMLRSLVGATKYIMLTHKRLSSIYIGILVKNTINKQDIKDIKVKATRTGIGNLYGNKGAVGVSFRIGKTSFCFINAHLAAHRTSKCLQDRIENLVLIVQGLELGNSQIDFTHQFHVLYLLGDLNFRISGDFTSDTVVNMIDNNNFDQLKLNDELNTLRKPNTFEKLLTKGTLSYDGTYNVSSFASTASYLTGDDEWDDIEDEESQFSNPIDESDDDDEKTIMSVKKMKHKTKDYYKNKNKIKGNNILNLEHMLQSFIEGPITFAPTYKFEKGKNQYTNKRIPAWCDRILWVQPPHPCINIKQIYYTSSGVTPPISDHRPVFSEFNITYNKSWNPNNNSEWSVSILNLHLYLFPHGKIAQPYLTIHSPVLMTCMRTQMGQTVTSQTSSASSSDLKAQSQSLMCYKFNSKQFVIKCIDNSNLGNGCLWIVVRDDNLLGDVDVIGASVIPLIDTKDSDVYVHFKRDVTFATAKKGYIEGQMKCTCIDIQ